MRSTNLRSAGKILKWYLEIKKVQIWNFEKCLGAF